MLWQWDPSAGSDSTALANHSITLRKLCRHCRLIISGWRCSLGDKYCWLCLKPARQSLFNLLSYPLKTLSRTRHTKLPHINVVPAKKLINHQIPKLVRQTTRKSCLVTLYTFKIISKQLLFEHLKSQHPSPPASVNLHRLPPAPSVHQPLGFQSLGSHAS